MDASDELIELEERGWIALSSGGQAAAEFYQAMLDAEVVMLLPGGTRLTDRSLTIDVMSGAPWSDFRLEVPQVLWPTAETGVITYGVTAHRDGQPEYSALVSTLYVRREDGWKVSFHQQTPRS